MGGATQRFAPIDVLIVEDNPDDLEIARRAFRETKVPARLSVARDGQEAVDLLLQGSPGERPDLVILDIKLPKLTGFEVLAIVRRDERSSAIPIVMLSASGKIEDVDASYRLGANSYIQKPVEYDGFRQALAVFAEYWLKVATLPSDA